jgi:hypothetical protein
MQSVYAEDLRLFAVPDNTTTDPAVGCKDDHGVRAIVTMDLSSQERH